MGLISYKRGQGSIVVRVKFLNSSVATGAGLAGLTFNSASLIIGAIADNEAATVAYTQAGGTIEDITTLGTYQAPTATKCRFKEVDSTNHKGVYEIQIADARYAVSGAKSLIISFAGATNMAETDVVIPLLDNDPYANKLLAYVQLLARGDDAIETDNATELAEINADEGSGAGGFDNETDSVEAIRERGDLAWLTGGSGGATKSYTTTDWTRTVGDDDGGTGADTLSVNATYFATGEVGTGTYLEVDAVFTLDAVTETARVLDIWGFYQGGGNHSIQVQALDTVAATYEPIGSMGLETVVSKHAFGLSPNHTNSSTGTVTIKFLHVGTGIPSHVLNIDKAQVNSSVPATSAADTADVILARAVENVED